MSHVSDCLKKLKAERGGFFCCTFQHICFEISLFFTQVLKVIRKILLAAGRTLYCGGKVHNPDHSITFLHLSFIHLCVHLNINQILFKI